MGPWETFARMCIAESACSSLSEAWQLTDRVLARKCAVKSAMCSVTALFWRRQIAQAGQAIVQAAGEAGEVAADAAFPLARPARRRG